MKNTLLVVPFNDAKECYVGQAVKIQLSRQGASAPGERPLAKMTGHVIRCEQDGAQTIVEIEPVGKF